MINSRPVWKCLFFTLWLCHPLSAYAQEREIFINVFGGRRISVVLQNGMPNPAEDNNIKIEVAGLGSHPDKNDPTKRSVFWIFGFKQKQWPKIINVKIEELYPDKPDRLVTLDPSPVMKNGDWSSHTESLAVSASSTPWLYENKSSAFIFRFTVNYEDGSQSVLHQMSIFPSQAKLALIEPIKPKKP